MLETVPPPSPKATAWARVRERIGFHISFVLAAIAVAVLFWPFRYVLLFAVMIVVVAHPLFLRMCTLCRGRRTIAALITTLGLLILVLTPITLLLRTAIIEAGPVLMKLQALVSEPGRLEAATSNLESMRDKAPDFVRDLFPSDIAESIRSSMVEVLNEALQAISNAVPRILRGLFGFAIGLIIFVFAVVSLFLEGPRLQRFLMKLWPIDNTYERRLFKVFARTAHNVIIASLAAAFVQGCVAAVGYRIAGMERVIFLGMLTGICAYIPMVGTSIIWIPVTLAVYLERGFGWALFVALWSALFTGTVDNIVKPLLVRGGSGIHPLLVFLAVFGGLFWMGVPGVLVGPVIVAMFLALCEIYENDFASDLVVPVTSPTSGAPLTEALPQVHP